jgi:hypothetical protein
MATLAKTVTENELLRKVAIPAYRAYARAMVFNPAPRVLAVSMPKAGTHLVASLLKAFPRMMFSGRHHVLGDFVRPGIDAHPPGRRGTDWSEREEMWESEIDWDLVERTLRTVNRGQYMTAHFAALPRLVDVLSRLGYKTVVITRDPRDVVVSGAHYIARLRRHRLHDRFVRELPRPEDRIMASIRGLPAMDGDRGLGPVGRRIERYRGWLRVPSAYVCRFEDLVGPHGGGSAEAQLREIEGIARHIDRPLDRAGLERVAATVWSPGSSTFRKGAIGDWSNHFTEAHKSAFKEEAGHLLVELGYERDTDW